MKKLICILVSALAVVSVVLTGCTGTYDKTPDQFSKITWTTSDYSLRFAPDNDCKGRYTFDGKPYDIRLEFGPTRVTAYDADDADKVFFQASWTYEEEDYLYIYDIKFNTNDYKLLKENFVEFLRLYQDKKN